MKKIFKNFQAGILKGNGRNHTAYVLLRFNTISGQDQERIRHLRLWLIKMGKTYITSHHKQCQDSKKYKKNNTYQKFVCSLALSYKGYKKAGIPDEYIPKDKAFRDGLLWVDRLKNLFGGYNLNIEQDLEDLDALLIISHNNIEVLENKVESLLHDKKILKIISSYALQYGFHGGSKDFPEQITGPLNFTDGHSQSKNIFKNWASVAIREPWPYKCKKTSYGSYMTFKKLEVHSEIFYNRVKEIASHHKINEELAAALFIGRFRNGTPLAKYPVIREPFIWSKNGVDHPFDYNNDAEGSKCPLNAHVRATNPRGEQKFAPIIRRSTNYSEPGSGATLEELFNKVTGLFFVSYQYDIDNQFESLFDNIKKVGDLLIYPNVSSNNPKKVTIFKKWGDPNAEKISEEVPDLISFLGGEYLFVPSIRFLRKLETFPIKIPDPS